MAIEKDLLDQLLAGRDPKDVFNKDWLVDELKKALSERILDTELDEHLDGDGAEGKSNHRNGYSKKSVLTGTSKMTLSVPRDRAGTFDPKLIAKYQRPRAYIGRLAGSIHPNRRASHQRACACGQASKLSAEGVLQHLLVEAQIGDHLPQLAVLILQLLEPPHLGRQ